MDVGHYDIKILTISVLHVDASEALLSLFIQFTISFCFSITFRVAFNIKVSFSNSLDIDIALSK